MVKFVRGLSGILKAVTTFSLGVYYYYNHNDKLIIHPVTVAIIIDIHNV